MTIEIQTDATWEPVSLSQAKTHARVDIDDDDSLITSLIKAARHAAEVECQRTIPQKTLVMKLPRFPSSFGGIRLSLPPVQSVSSIKYYDGDNDLQTVNSAYYIVYAHADGCVIVPVEGYSWPVDLYDRPDAMQVTYVAGYESADDVPNDIQTWIKCRVTTMYDSRSQVATGSYSENKFIDRILDPHRLIEA